MTDLPYTYTDEDGDTLLIPDDGDPFTECECNVNSVEGPSADCSVHGATPVYESPQELAQKIEALTSERDRLRTAWESARRGRAQARETAGMERFFAGVAEADVIRLRKELRAESARVSQARDERDQALQAAREVTGRLPEADMVEPGDEVPALAELHALVERLALDLSETTKAVTKRLAAVETHLGITDDTTDEDPAAPVKSSLCLAESPLPTPSGYPYLCEADAGHDGNHYALRGSETWAEAAPADGILPPVRELHRMHEQEHGPTT